MLFCLALAATIFLCLSDIEMWWKLLAATVCVASFLLPDDGGWIVVPVSMQLALAIWGLVYWDGPLLRR